MNSPPNHKTDQNPELSGGKSEGVPDLLVDDETNVFIAPIPYIGIVDSEFIEDNIKKHFISTSSLIDKYIKRAETRLESLKSEQSDLELHNLQPSSLTLSYTNADIWRRYVVVMLKSVKYELQSISYLIPAYKKILQILFKLKLLSDDLQENPQMVCFSRVKLHYLMKYEIPKKLQFKLTSTKLLLYDLKNAMSFVPRSFTPRTAAEYLISILQSATRMKDPITGYLKESIEYFNFFDLVKSRSSPLVRVPTLADQTTEVQISSSIKLLKAFSAIDDKESNLVLGPLCMRFWLDQKFEVDKYMKKINPKLTRYIAQFQGANINDVNPPKELQKLFEDNPKIEDFVHLNLLLNPSSESLSMCIYYSNPCDISNQINTIKLRIFGVIAESLRAELSDNLTLIGTEFLWKLVLIVSNPPGIDGILEFASHWQSFQYAPSELYESNSIPLKVIHSFIEEMEKTNFI